MSDSWKSYVRICRIFLLLLLSGTAQEAAAKLTISWNDSANNETGFSIERTKPAGGTMVLLAVPANPQDGQTVYDDTGVVAGTQYCYRVRAFNAAGESAYSNQECGIPSVDLDDTDGDSLTNDAELNQYGTDPNDSDTDGDGLADEEEVNQYATDPNNGASPLCGGGSLEQGGAMVLAGESVANVKYYRASQSISAGSSFVVTSGGCVRFSAAGTIRLQAGFQVDGGRFEANIE